MDTLTKEAELKATAHHEAGHVLLHLLTGIEMTGVNIIEDSDKYGSVGVVNYGSSSGLNSEMRNDVIKCYLAGGIAGEIYCKRKLIKHDPDGSGYDYSCITQILYEGGHKFKCFENYEKHVDKLRRATEVQIKNHWSFIEIVAEALLSKKQLTPEEINALWSEYNDSIEQYRASLILKYNIKRIR